MVPAAGATGSKLGVLEGCQQHPHSRNSLRRCPRNKGGKTRCWGWDIHPGRLSSRESLTGTPPCLPLLPDQSRRTQGCGSLELASPGCCFSGMQGELSSGKAAQRSDAAAPWPGSVPAQSVLPSPGFLAGLGCRSHTVPGSALSGPALVVSAAELYLPHAR